jgi:hypothetical protein
MRRLVEVGSLRLMAGRTNLDLSRCRLHRIFWSVQTVTASAGHIACRVRARCPVVSRVRLMTAQALRILRDGRRQRFCAEIDHARERSATGLDVRAAWPVASFALQATVAKRAMSIIGPRVLGPEDAGNRGVVVTPKAGVRPLRTVAGVCMRRPVGRECKRCAGQRQHEHRHAYTWEAQISSPWWECGARPADRRCRPDRGRHCSFRR